MPVPSDPPPELRVLVVDDNIEAATTLCYLLQIAGCRTAIGFGGLMGLRVAQLFQPTLMLIDFDMPGMDGCELLVRLKELPGPMEHAVAVCLTGMDGPELEARCRAAGFDHFLSKPIDGEALAGLIAESRARVAVRALEGAPPSA
jgi:CheY-like chemotaxis protein